MSAAGAYLRGLRPELPRDAYVLQAGLLINAFGNGAGNPFLVLYLANVREIPLAIAGLAGSTSASSALIAAAAAGHLADTRGARGTMIAGLLLSIAGWGLYPLVREPWQAIALATLTGSGIGVWLTLQSTVLALLVPPGRRHAAFAQQRVAANLGLGLGGFAGGLLVTTAEPNTFTLLFLLNASTFAIYALFVARLRLPPPRAHADTDGGYRQLLLDRRFLRLLALNLAFVAASVALINLMFPVFARNHAGVSENTIGLLFLLNALVIVTIQLPVTKAIEGHRRARGLALMCLFFATAWSLVELAGAAPAAAVPFLLAGIACLSIGECLYDSIYAPLVADLAPEGKTGRYMAASGLAWQIGSISAPAAGGAILGAQPYALWPLIAGIALLAGAYSLRFESQVPPPLRRTPHRAPVAAET